MWGRGAHPAENYSMHVGAYLLVWTCSRCGKLYCMQGAGYGRGKNIRVRATKCDKKLDPNWICTGWEWIVKMLERVLKEVLCVVNELLICGTPQVIIVRGIRALSRNDDNWVADLRQTKTVVTDVHMDEWKICSNFSFIDLLPRLSLWILIYVLHIPLIVTTCLLQPLLLPQPHF